MGGTPGHRSRSPTSMPRCRMAACSVSASGTRNRMPVSAPVSGLAISATDVDAPGAATVTQRKLSPIRASSRFSKPSVPVKNSTALSWSRTGIPTVPMSVMVVWDMAISSRRWKRLLLRLVHERAGSGQRLPGFEPRLQAGQDHRPSAVELGRRVRWQLIVHHRQAARVADRLDLPGHPRRTGPLGVRTPQRAHRLHQPVRPFDDQVLPLDQRPLRGRVTEPVGRACSPVRLDRRAELVFRPDRRVGDRLPQPLGRGADVDLEDLLHLILQLVLQADEPGSPRLGVIADPPVVDQADRDRVEVVQLLAAPPPAHDEPGVLEDLQVLRHGDARHVVPRREGHERLTVAGEQLIKQRPPGRVGQCPEHEIHVTHDRKPFGFLSTQARRAGRASGHVAAFTPRTMRPAAWTGVAARVRRVPGEPLTIASLNTRGIPLTGSQLAERYAVIGAGFEAGDADVVCCQEVFTYWHLRMLVRRMRSFRQVSYRPGPFGPYGGLVTVSP